MQRRVETTQDLNEEFCREARNILQHLKWRQPIQTNEHSGFLSSQEARESMQYRTVTTRMYSIEGQLDCERFHNERRSILHVMGDYCLIYPTASNEE